MALDVNMGLEEEHEPQSAAPEIDLEAKGFIAFTHATETMPRPPGDQVHGEVKPLDQKCLSTNYNHCSGADGLLEMVFDKKLDVTAEAKLDIPGANS